MKAPKKASIKLKFTFFTTLLVILVASSLSTYIRQGQKKAIVEEGTVSRANTLKALRQVAREAILVDDDTDMVNYLNLLKRSLTTAYAMVLNPDGSVRVHTDSLQMNKVLNDRPTTRALASRNRHKPLEQHLKLEDGRKVMDISIPIMIGLDPPEFHGIARIGFDKEAMDKVISRALKEVDGRILKAFVVALILGILGAILLSVYMTRPIAVLREGAKKIGEGKLDHQIHVNSHDELEELSDEFNTMARKLAELDEMKRDFVSNVTHELRSPLTSIKGYLNLLLGDDKSLNETQKDYLSVVKNSSVRLSRFIDNLLDVAKIEAQRLKLSPESQPLYELGHEMQVLFKPQADEKKIKLTNDIAKDFPAAFVDKDKMAEVLINFTSNAIKFTPEGGEIKFAAKEFPKYLEVGIHDTGMGIPKDKINSLFNKFVQIKTNKGMASQKGTGLGLTIAKGIVEAHGGKVWIESPAPWGKGTVFYFTVPKLTDDLKKKLGLA